MSDVVIILRDLRPQVLAANSMLAIGSAYVAPYGNELVWSTSIQWSSAANNTLMKNAILASVKDAANTAGLTVNVGDMAVFITVPTATPV